MDMKKPMCKGLKLLIMGLLIVGARKYYPSLDLWAVVGGLLIAKAILVVTAPNFMCDKEEKKKK